MSFTGAASDPRTARLPSLASRFDGEEIEAALEATTGWQFMVEELEGIGAQVHLAEPAETSARRGPKKRAKSDRQLVFRLMAKHVARSLGCVATFMPKPFSGGFGSGAHLNLNLATSTSPMPRLARLARLARTTSRQTRSPTAPP